MASDFSPEYIHGLATHARLRRGESNRAADIVVLSPHLDDAVMAVGGMISREIAQGRTVEIWTCFTEGPGYDIRREEDRRALGVLGAGYRWLGLRERILREPPLQRPHHIFHTPADVESFTALPTLRGIARELILGSSKLFAPLAVGHHHDHVEVALAVLVELLSLRRFDRVQFYEDPYAHGGVCRRHHFLARRRLWRPWVSPAWASPRVGALLLAAGMCSRGPQLEDYVPGVTRLPWSYTDAPVEPDDERRKLTAVAEYKTQVKSFGGMPGVSAFMRQVHVALNGEPVWQAQV